MGDCSRVPHRIEHTANCRTLDAIIRLLPSPRVCGGECLRAPRLRQSSVVRGGYNELRVLLACRLLRWRLASPRSCRPMPTLTRLLSILATRGSVFAVP